MAEECEKKWFGHKIAKNVDLKYENGVLATKVAEMWPKSAKRSGSATKSLKMWLGSMKIVLLATKVARMWSKMSLEILIYGKD